MTVPAKRLFAATLGLLLLFSLNAAAHELRTPVIVDTDMALDDVRALALMLSSPHVRVRAIVTSDGSSSPRAGCRNVLRVLQYLGIKDMPIGVGRSVSQPPPPWREQSEALGWADLPDISVQTEAPDAVSLIMKLVRGTEENLTYVCLGPMTNLADALREEPSLRQRIRSVFFFGTPQGAHPSDWNTARDPESVERVSSSGIPVYFVHLGDDELLPFDLELLADVRKLDSDYSHLLNIVHHDERVQRLLREGHFRAWDETVALYMEDPSLGTMRSIQEALPLFVLSDWNRDAARKTYLRLFSGLTEHEINPRMPVVLLKYPTNPGDLQNDIRHLIPDVITRHGLEEWKAALLTNELHRHLGIYSILGAKMGIRARELLSASLDDLNVESYAGLNPPLSCMNDGLQASTGASLGRGTIKVLDGSPFPAATFSIGDKKLTLRTREEVLKRIRADIKNAIDRYGALTPDYFKEVRRLSIQYWLDLDRREIFEQQIEAAAKSN